MNISKLISGVTALTLLTSVALAEPNVQVPVAQQASQSSPASAAIMQTAKQSNDGKAMAKKTLILSDKQMDTVSAGAYCIDMVCGYSLSQFLGFVPFAAKIQIYQ